MVTVVPLKVTALSVDPSSPVVNVIVVPEYVTSSVAGETIHCTDVDPVTVIVVAVPSRDTSVEASPTTHCVVSPARRNSTVVFFVKTRSVVVPSIESVVVVPDTITSRDVLSAVAVQVVVVPSTVNVVAVAANLLWNRMRYPDIIVRRHDRASSNGP